MLEYRALKRRALAIAAGALGALCFGAPRGEAAERVWDQARAKKMMATVLEVEGGKKRPWNRIPWRANLSNAVKEARNSGKPLFVFFFVECDGPPLERCGPEGRLLRAHALSDSTVLSLVKSHFIPVKLKLEKGKPFPVTWPALEKWAAAFKFSNGRGFTGCSVVSSDLAIEYANSGSARLHEMLDSPAFDSKRFAAMLERAVSRVNEERSLRVQRRIQEFERKMEIHRFRKGVTRAVRAESPRRLAPKGYSLEHALELYRMVGAHERKDPSGPKKVAGS